MRRPPNLWKHPKSGVYYVRLYDAAGKDLGRKSCRTRDLREAASKAPGVRAELEAIIAAKSAPQAVVVVELGDKRIEAAGAALAPHQIEWVKLQAADVAERLTLGCTQLHADALEGKWKLIVRELATFPGPDAFDYDDALRYIAHRRAMTFQGRPIRGATIYVELAAILRGLKIAVRRGMRATLPLEWPKVRRGRGKDQRKSGKNWDIALVREYLAALHRDARDECGFAAVTMLRAFEIKRFRASFIRPAPAGSATPYIATLPAEATKIGEEREVGITQFAYAIVMARVAEHGNDIVFSPQNFKKHRREVSRRLNFTCTLTMRDLRHTFSTLSLELNPDPTALMRHSGQKDLSTTERYLSTTEIRATKVAAAADAMLGLGDYPAHHDPAHPSIDELTATDVVGEDGDLSGEEMERATRLELATPSLGIRGSAVTRKEILALARLTFPSSPEKRGPVLIEPAHQPGTPPAAQPLMVIRKRGGAS